MIRSYDPIASRYEKMHARWLRHAGGEAQVAFEAAVLSNLEPGMRVLDAGGGTGRLCARMIEAAPGSLDVTLCDTSARMLEQAAHLPIRRRRGCLLSLPFAASSFDLVTAAWSIEATEDPARALRELMRVLTPSGRLFLVFCSDSPAVGVAARFLRKGVELRGTGRFLHAEAIHRALQRLGGTAIVRHAHAGPATCFSCRRANATGPSVDMALAA